MKQVLTLTIGMFGVWWSVLKLFPRPNGTRKAAIIILKQLYALQRQPNTIQFDTCTKSWSAHSVYMRLYET